MATFTDTWNGTYEGLPPDTVEAASQGAGRIRSLKLAVRERLAIDHSIAGDGHDGKHNKVTLRVQGSSPALDADDAAVYTKANAYGKSKLFLKDEEATDIPLNGGFDTGDVKLTFKTTADPGWVVMNDGSIGSASSGASNRANADCEALFKLLWANVIDTWAPVSGGRGASAAADWTANKTLTLPKALGRALAVSGAGSGLTSRVLGENLGAETHTLTQGETPLKSHSHSVTDPGHFHTGGASFSNNSTLGTQPPQDGSPVNTGTATTGLTVNTASDATASAHNNMQPSSFFNVHVKL